MTRVLNFEVKGMTCRHIEINEVIWSRDYEKLIEELNAEHIDRVNITDHSTALMETLHILLTNGWKVVAAVEKQDDNFTRLGLECLKKGLVLERA